MALTQEIWSLEKKQPLSIAELKDEKELELLLIENIELLNKGWLVIGNQVKTNAGKFIDILCIDHDGDIVVIELKKDLTPREVTAQVIDYAASVSTMTSEEFAQIYLNYTNNTETLNDAYQKKFKSILDENSINQNVKMVIVAAKMDDGTERIIHFLRETYQVDINILFFQVFQAGPERLISRVWLEEDIEEMVSTDAAKKRSWNGEYYSSFGEGSRRWEDAMRFGFISAGGGSWYSKTLSLLSQGDRVWVNIPHTGYVGVGTVTTESTLASDSLFMIDGVEQKMKDLPLKGNYFDSDDPENAEYVVKIEWIKKVPIEKAVKEVGFFGNQNSVCRPLTEKWHYTIERLKKIWNLE